MKASAGKSRCKYLLILLCCGSYQLWMGFHGLGTNVPTNQNDIYSDQTEVSPFWRQQRPQEQHDRNRISRVISNQSARGYNQGFDIGTKTVHSGSINGTSSAIQLRPTKVKDTAPLNDTATKLSKEDHEKNNNSTDIETRITLDLEPPVDTSELSVEKKGEQEKTSNEFGNESNNEDTRKSNDEPAAPASDQSIDDKFYDGFFFSDYTNAWTEQEEHPTAGFIGQDAFSGSWWQSKEQFLRYEEVENENPPSPEGASFDVMDINDDNMRVTRDWIDLNVEHMSRWFRGLLETRHNSNPQPTLERILEIFQNYVHSEDRLFMWERLEHESDRAKHQHHHNHIHNFDAQDWLEVSQSTIAVIAYMPYGQYGGAEITKWSLAATMMSLVQLGVGRIIVSGNQDSYDQQSFVQEAWQEVLEVTKSWTTSKQKRMTTHSFCSCDKEILTDKANATEGENKTTATATTASLVESNIPYAALRRLRYILLHRDDEFAKGKDKAEAIRRCWAGSSKGQQNKTDSDDSDPMDQWKYVFLGEPDLILNTRPLALPKLAGALTGGGVLAPHRLQPLPHASDFGVNGLDLDSLKLLIPNLPPHFDNIAQIDQYERISNDDTHSSGNHGGDIHGHGTKTRLSNHACCDAGNQKPYRQFETCDSWWWNCAFTALQYYDDNHYEGALEALVESNNETYVLDLHKRHSVYPMVRLKRGTGVVFAGGESGRMCNPSQLGTCKRQDKTERNEMKENQSKKNR
ncbi:unnamed protein product [Pseudo-nitzschia multistriata]|uniref:Uncharacterized protein n=1 Tax=Pseudo-nitzschia multistriata TaxID=183589 RepID=A0A448Z401_9STRA|nr:unnamed protein product [Pseudo-nitzschia multistriata]